MCIVQVEGGKVVACRVGCDSVAMYRMDDDPCADSKEGKGSDCRIV